MKNATETSERIITMKIDIKSRPLTADEISREREVLVEQVERLERQLKRLAVWFSALAIAVLIATNLQRQWIGFEDLLAVSATAIAVAVMVAGAGAGAVVLAGAVIVAAIDVVGSVAIGAGCVAGVSVFLQPS